MRKIPTLFKRDPEDMKRVLREVHPDCQWVLDGEGIPTRKFDGTCVLNDTDGWWARREVKPGKQPPPHFRPEQTDEATGKTVGWEPAAGSAFAKYLDEAIAHADTWPLGTYELCGPKVNGNPEGYKTHVLVPHGLQVLKGVPLDYDGLAAWLSRTTFEGIVWHHPDGRMAKLKKRDFPAGGRG